MSSSSSREPSRRHGRLAEGKATVVRRHFGLQKDFEIFGREAAKQFLGELAVLQDATR
jgi:hypothetical protein